jgi:tetratricopeptide (TPR) repeat protein
MIRKLIYIALFSIISTNLAFCQTHKAQIEYNNARYTFQHGDENKFLAKAAINLFMAEKSPDVKEKIAKLQESMRYYFLISQINPRSLEAQIGLGRVYDAMTLNKFAKEHFYMALDISRTNPKANYYFGNYYFKRADYINAIYYYKIAYQNGYANDFDLNYNMATIYEKLADVEAAKKFYTDALALRKGNEELNAKIRLLDDLNYSQSQYYLFKDNQGREKINKGIKG